jgi:hypothetical protein
MLWAHHLKPPMAGTTSCPRPWLRAEGLWHGPVIKEGLRFWIRRDVLSHGPALGANSVTQRIQLARVAAYLHRVCAATLLAAHSASSRLDPIQQGQSASG